MDFEYVPSPIPLIKEFSIVNMSKMKVYYSLKWVSCDLKVNKVDLIDVSNLMLM